MASFVVRMYHVMSVWAWDPMPSYVLLVALFFRCLICTRSLTWVVDFQSVPMGIEVGSALEPQRFLPNPVVGKLRKSKVPGTTAFQMGKLRQDSIDFRRVPAGSWIFPAGTRGIFNGSGSFPVGNGRWNLDLGRQFNLTHPLIISLEIIQRVYKGTI